MAAATRVVRSLLYEISPLDPVTFGGVGSMLMTVALLAALLPAVRAATMDPADSVTKRLRLLPELLRRCLKTAAPNSR